MTARPVSQRFSSRWGRAADPQVGHGGWAFIDGVNRLCPRLLQGFLGGVEGSLRVWVGRRDWDAPQLPLSLPPQLFLCCLLNLQESGLLCEVRRSLGPRVLKKGSGPAGRGLSAGQGRGAAPSAPPAPLRWRPNACSATSRRSRGCTADCGPA